jgi:lipoprotein-anchoring transpeptidase ErfK/SrfK
VKRAGLGLLLLVCALAGALLAVVVARPTTAATTQTTGTTATTATSTGTTTTGTTSTTTTATTTTAPTTTAPPRRPPPPRPPPPPPPPPAPRLIAPGVRVGGVAVGGLSTADATSVVRQAFAEPLVVIVNRSRLLPTPASLGARALVKQAVARARNARAGTAVPLAVRVRGERVRAYVERLAKRFDRTPVDSSLSLRGLKPFVTKDVTGRSLDRVRAREALVRALVRNLRTPIRLRVNPVEPAVTRQDIGAVIVIRRGSNRLELYDGMRLRRTFGVATGQARYPTPLGRFEIVVRWRDPWWYPPASDWAEGLEPVPPGPGNPLGTRWMGISSPGVGIHGTPDAGSIGYSVSHGCIRMQIPEAEWLFEQVSIGTPVFIVAA